MSVKESAHVTGSPLEVPLRVAIIGGGIAGLATAALLAKDGHEVTLLEASDAVGGRVGTWEKDGFRFDTGPSWYLMPEVFEHFYRLLGTATSKELNLIRLDPAYRVFFEGHGHGGRDEPAPVPSSMLEIPAGRERTTALFEAIEPGAGARLDTYLNSAGEAYQLALERFLYTSYQRKRDLLTPGLVPRLPHLLRLLTTSLDHHIGRFFHDQRLRQVLGYPAVFLGSAPTMTPALYHLMSHLDLDAGVLYPQGGFRRIIDSLEGLARSHGADIITGARAKRILTADSRELSGKGSWPRRPAKVHGVLYEHHGGDQTLDADVVVSTVDLHHSETSLLPPRLQTYPEKWWQHRTPGPGAVLVLLAVQGQLPELAHHSLFFTRDWDANFTAIFTPPTRVPDPASIYVCKPSATDQSVAPPGHENLFVLIPVPADPWLGHGGENGTGSPVVEATADAALQQIAAWAGIPDLKDRIVLRRTIGPEDFATGLNAWSGTALGPAHTLRQSAFLRGSNTSRYVDGLFFAGGSTLPGIGLPMCLISAELILKHLRGDTTTGPTAEPAQNPCPTVDPASTDGGRSTNPGHS